MPDASPPLKPLQTPPSVRSAVALLAAIAGLITAIAGLITAIAALRKQPEEPAARESYLVFQEAIKGLAAENDQFREQITSDQMSLRAAFEDYVRAKEGAANVANMDGPDAGDGSDAGDALPAVRIQVRRTPLPLPSATASARPLAIAPPPAEPLPEVVLPRTRSMKKAASRANIPSYDAIEAKAKR